MLPLTRDVVPELLAPAGDGAALRAAVANGADAVYFGLADFNARRRAANFALGELPNVLDYLHTHNVKGYVTLNTLILSGELAQGTEYVTAVARAGADAVIVQDLGLLRLIRRAVPTLPIHASTQMTQTEADGTEYLRSLGVSRVILARELTLPEIRRIAAATPMALEVFVHGALCISYSGQCLASESLWGRSANRGLCGQACRLPYQLLVDGQPAGSQQRAYPLSAQDLAAYDRVAELVELGIAGFKIEGRLKSACYVAAATRLTRAAIDAAVRHTPFVPTREQELEVIQSFSRGWCRGFLDGVDHQKLVHGRFPKNRGVLLGTVAAKTRGGVVVELPFGQGSAKRLAWCRCSESSGTWPSADPCHPTPNTAGAAVGASAGASTGVAPWPIKPGDGIVFDEGHPERDEQGGRVFSVEPVPPSVPTPAPGRRGRRRTGIGVPAPGRRVELTFGRGDVNLEAVGVGSRVWKTDDPVVRRRLQSSYARDRVIRRVPVHVQVEAGVGLPLVVRVRDDAGHEAQVGWNQPLRAAQRHPLSEALIREQFGRLGNTPFELSTVELIGPQGPVDVQPVMVPKSVLNDLRRRAVASLREQRAAAARHEAVEPGALETLRREVRDYFFGVRAERYVSGRGWHVLVRSLEQLEAVLRWARPASPTPQEMVYGDFSSREETEQAVALCRGAGRAIALATPRVLMPGETDVLERMARGGPQAVLVRNLGALAWLRRGFPQLPLIGDYSLNVANEIAAHLLSESGLVRVTPGYDVGEAQVAAMLEWVPPEYMELVWYRHVPMFHTRHCLLAAGLSKSRPCGDCDQSCRHLELHLRDRVGAAHPVVTDPLGRNTVFNAQVQCAVGAVSAFRKLGVRHFRIELLDESADETRRLLERT